MSLSCPRVQPRICRTTEAHGVAFAKLADVLGSFTCKYCLFSQLLIFFSWRFINVQMGESASHPPHQHNVCTEAQSSLRRRDSQTSRRGAKPVALSTRESLGVFNSLSYHFFLILYACMRGVCVCVCICVHESPLPNQKFPCYFYHSPICSPGPPSTSEWQWLHE